MTKLEHYHAEFADNATLLSLHNSLVDVINALGEVIDALGAEVGEISESAIDPEKLVRRIEELRNKRVR